MYFIGLDHPLVNDDADALLTGTKKAALAGGLSR
jgi:hypothetical protein